MARASDELCSSFKNLSLDSDFIDFKSKDIKEILKLNLKDMISVLEDCTCHSSSSCLVSKDMHKLVAQTIQIQQGAQRMESSVDGKVPVITRQCSIDLSWRRESEHFGHTTGSRNMEYQLRKDHSYESDSSGVSSSGSLEDESDFRVKKGYLLMVVNIWFVGRLDARNGAKEEGENVKSMFEALGFTVDTIYNASKEDIHLNLQHLAQDGKLDEFDCFALVMMSHGSEKGIHCSDNLPEKFETIIDKLKGDKCKALVGKPKLFFFQSCRGSMKDEGQVYFARGKNAVSDGRKVEHNPAPAYRIPTDSEILMVCATTQGRTAYRPVDKTYDGRVISKSWLFEAMQQVFMQYSDHEDLMSMMTRVNSHVAMMGNEEIGMQMPCEFSTLTRKVFFSKST